MVTRATSVLEIQGFEFGYFQDGWARSEDIAAKKEGNLEGRSIWIERSVLSNVSLYFFHNF